MIPDTCPYCGATGEKFEIYALEWVPGRSGIARGKDGKAEWAGGIDMIWEESRTEDYWTLCCETMIPSTSDLAFAIDAALDNQRYEVSFT